jgi:translation initiation factor IF-2
MKLTPEMIERLRNASARGQKMTIADITRPQPAAAPGGPSRGPESRSGPGSAARIAGRPQQPTDSGSGTGGDDEEEKKKGPGVIGRDSRHKSRQDKGRQSGPRVDRGSVVIGSGGVETIDERFGSRRGPRAALLRKHMRGKQQQAPAKEGRIEIALPITIRSLSETIGMKVGDLTKRLLKETNQLYGINSVIDFDAAALIAVEKNIELVAKKQETKEDVLLERYRKMLEEVDEEKLRPRPPIVTIMGHVDHGKTSLLDKIRQNYGITSDVVSTEAGGITQVIRAWSVKRDVVVERDGQEVQEERFITFLDTPGHEAFTKMRARGANVTDIAVIVVAATDGVMPQTQEAINHAKAAEVKIVVAINKVDMPNANVERTRRQLYNEGLIPDDMGGDVQFVETSAVTGAGISELLDTIVLVAEVEELTADPDRPAAGTCLEAYMTADEGVMATVLIQQGTLKKGDIVLCGSTYGRVRAMYNDMGRPISQAGPSTPVRITGLGAVPNADDPFYVVEEIAEAKEIAEDRLKKEREAALVKLGPKSLDSLKEATAKAKITELKVILKAEARGSVEAIKKELEKLVHDEVRTRVLHTGIGAITESDVQLALTSPDDTLVIGFNVTADDAALKLAEERGISIREYDIIYKLTDDVKAALEGRLKPIEEVVHLGRAVVRQTFKISKTGTIAGCFVTSGLFERSARVRVIREGVVIFPPGEKVVGLDSLKRVKDDVKEVREGFECGMKITGFDDVKVGDVIEAFKIETRQRTL